MTTTDNASIEGVRIESGPRRFAIPLICLAQLMATLDVTIVNLALPAVQRDLGLSNAGLAWVIDAYTLAYAGLLLVGGRTGRPDRPPPHADARHRGVHPGVVDRRPGRRRQRPAGGPRPAQGIGAALATPTTLSLITTLTGRVRSGPRRWWRTGPWPGSASRSVSSSAAC